jgi:hypothetical protein
LNLTKLLSAFVGGGYASSKALRYAILSMLLLFVTSIKQTAPKLVVAPRFALMKKNIQE